MNKLLCACLATATLLASSLAPAQMPAPFSAMPADAEVFARVDFQALSTAPGFSDLASHHKDSNPDFQNTPFYVLPDLQEVMRSANGVEAVIYEVGARVLPEEPVLYIIVYGKFNPGGIFQAAQAAGFTAGPRVGELATLQSPAADYVLTMLNDWTLAMAESPEDLQKIIAAQSGQAAPLADQPVVSGFTQQAQGAIISMAMRNDGGLKSAIEQLSAAPPQEAMAVPGALPVIKDLARLAAGGLSFGPTGFYFELDYADAEAAQKGAQDLNLLVRGTAALARQQMSPELLADPDAGRQIEALQNINLAAVGTKITHTIPQSAEEMQKLARAVQAGAATAMQIAQQAQAEALPAASAPAGTIIPAAQRQEFPNFQAADIKNEFVDLDQYEGKVVLVDYWATWCGPCRATKPFIKDMYARRHGDGLEIIGVSLDEDINALRTYVTREKMPWRQVTDLKGWNSQYAQQMGVDSIPHVFVLDKQGNIAARGGLRGEELETIIAQVMAE